MYKIHCFDKMGKTDYCLAYVEFIIQNKFRTIDGEFENFNRQKCYNEKTGNLENSNMLEMKGI